MFQSQIRRLSSRQPQAVPYRSRLSFYYIYTLLVIVVSSVLAAYFFDKSLSDEIAVSNKRLLTQIRISTDAKLASLQSFVLENFVNTYKNNGAAMFLAGNDPNDAYQILKAFTSLSLTSYGDFVDSAFMYRLADDTLISSREGVIFSAMNPNNYNRNYFRIDTIREALQTTEAVSWISPARNRSTFDDKSMLSLVYTVPLFASADRKDGIIVINIDERKFVQAINNDDRIDYGVYMLGPDNNVMVHLDKNGVIPQGGGDPIISAVANREEGFAKTTVGDSALGVSWVKSSLNGWKYVSYAPFDALNKQRTIALQLALVLLGLFILISMIGLKVISNRVNRPVKQMISSLSMRVEEMETVLQINYPLVRHKILDDLVRGNSSDYGREIANQLEMIGVTFTYESFAVFITELRKQDVALLSPEQREYATFKMMETIDTLQSTAMRFHSISLSRNRIVTIVNAAAYEDVYTVLNGWAGSCGEPFDITANVALSECADDWTQLGRLYDQAEGYLAYRFIYGYGQLFGHESMDRLNGSTAKLNAKWLEELTPLLVAGKIAQVRQQLETIFRALAYEKLSYSYVYNYLMDIITLIDRMAKELQLCSTELDKPYMFAKLHEMSALEECRLWLVSCVDLFGELLDARIHSSDDQLGTKVTAFILSHIDKDISLNVVADHFHLSPTYLSRVFKDIAGVNFSTYVTNQKLMKARQLLIADKKVKVTQVANQLGYYNLPYFSSIFKEKYGMTPMQLRKLDTE